MDDDYFVTRPPGDPGDPRVESMDLAALLGADADRARLESRTRLVLQVLGGTAAFAALVLVVVSVLAVIRFFESLPF